LHSANLRNRLLRLAGRRWPTPRAHPGLPERVLLIRPDHIGDVLLTSPAVALVRASLPRAHLTYLVGPWSAQAAWLGVPVDRVETLAFPAFTRQHQTNQAAPYALLARQALQLHQRQYDLAVVFRPDHWWGALLARVAGIGVRVGALTPETQSLLSHAQALAPGLHAVEESLAIATGALEAVGAARVETRPEITINISEQARGQAAAWWRAHGLEGKRVMAIQPSAGAMLKSWPIGRWAALADGLGEPVVLTGGPDDAPLVQSIARALKVPPPVACGQSLEITAALFERCALVIAPDSGAAHLAAAVGTPTVRLYGPAPSSRYGPWPRRADQQVLTTDALACVPCGDLEHPPCGARAEPACMLAVGIADVLTAAKAVLAGPEN
jgi:heptosyltransferase-2/heptosyltransferase-3